MFNMFGTVVRFVPFLAMIYSRTFCLISNLANNFKFLFNKKFLFLVFLNNKCIFFLLYMTS